MKHINISKKLSAFAAALLLLFVVFSTFRVSNAAHAATTTLKFDSSNVLTDLQTGTVNGKSFNLADYPFDEKLKPQLLSFLEYCYSYKSSNQDYYGLYVYIYNPQGKAFNTASGRNKISLRFGNTGNYNKYNLQFLNYSTQAGYEGLFYKFKVVLSDAQKKNILASLSQAGRIYEVIGVELCVDTEVTEYECSLKYTYSGYAKGYGPDTAISSSLSCVTDGIKDVLHLNVKPVFYRPDGTNGKNNYTQDSLHSVYFAVPNEFIRKYGEMTAVHATWLNAVLKPVLVTGNKKAYDAISSYLGVNVGDWTKELEYSYYGAFETHTQSGASFSVTEYYAGYSYNGTLNQQVHSGYRDKYGYKIDTLYLMFYAGSGTDSADHFTVTSKAIQDAMLESKSKFGGELVNGKYSKAIFESVDDEFVDINIERDKEYKLTEENITQSWWQKLWGTGTVVSNEFDGIKAIYAIDKENDFVGKDEDIAKRLYVDEMYIGNLKTFCNAPENADSTVYLFRYQVSDYISEEATLYQYDPNDSWWDDFLSFITHSASYKFGKVDTNAYFFQETVNLDFDIIDVTFTKDGVKTVIPVVMSPIDIIPDGTPPVYTNSDEENPLLRILFALLMVILLLVILMPILPQIIPVIVWIVMLPIKLVKGIIKGLKS